MNKLELEFYKDNFLISHQTGHSWHVTEAHAVIIESEHGYELIYTNAVEHPLAGSYLIARLAVLYPDLLLRPLNLNFFGLISFLRFNDVVAHCRKKRHLVHFDFPKITAAEFIRYCDGL